LSVASYLESHFSRPEVLDPHHHHALADRLPDEDPGPDESDSNPLKRLLEDVHHYDAAGP
jgi:hypothetical protein